MAVSRAWQPQNHTLRNRTQNSIKPIAVKRISKKKVKTLTWHKLGTVRKRACALQESFYPHEEVSYAAVKTRMATLLGIVDRISILAYLGRPKYILKGTMEQTVIYRKSGTVVPKTHRFKRTLPAKRGYIDLFGLGYVFVKEPKRKCENGEWFIHWTHKTVVNEVFRAPSTSEMKGVGNMENISLTTKGSKQHTHSTPKNRSEHHIERQRRERDTLCEREISCFAVNTAKKQLRDSKGHFKNTKTELWSESK